MGTKTPVGLQLYSIRGEVQNDLPATLAKVAALGYAGVEPYGYQGDDPTWMGYQAQTLRTLFDDHGLVCCGMHVGTCALMGDNLKRSVELNLILGNPYLIIAGDHQRMSAPDSVRAFARTLDSIAAILKPLGMACGYHAHPSDFEMMGGDTAWDLLFGHTMGEVVMQMDTGNCLVGGGDPIAIMEKFPGRAKTIHIKEHGGAPGAVIGEGEIDWATFFDVSDRLHEPAWYVVEEETTEGGLGFGQVERSINALKAMGRA